MKSQGSVLIVVLGLLAILAVVGVTFVTMSSVDRATASNFALQSQFMLAADGAVDYVSHHLIQDLWAFDPTTKKYKESTAGGATGQVPLLSDDNSSGSTLGLIRNEPWDSPAPTFGDPWLSPTIQSTTAPNDTTFPYSYRKAIAGTGSYLPYGLNCWGAEVNSKATDYTYRANNLGIPGGDPDDPSNIDPFRPANGVWIPDLSFPFETGLIRVSVTVIDQNSMVNLNAHGNSTEPELGDLKGQGYFVSDIDPQATNCFSGNAQLSHPLYGLYRDNYANPGNKNLLQAVIENPAKYHDYPFTLDEEFELRRLRGTPFYSRLEHLESNIMINDPKTEMNLTKVLNRMKVTTVGWTSEIRRNKCDTSTPVYPPNGAGWSSRKADVNLDNPVYIYQSMLAAGAVPIGQKAAFKQFCANIAGFRDGSKGVGIKAFTGFDDADTNYYCSASRQPLFTKVSATSAPNADGTTTWSIKLEVWNPWPADVAGMAGGLTVSGMNIAGGGGTLAPAWDSTPMNDLTCRIYTLSVKCNAGEDIVDIVHKAPISLTCKTGGAAERTINIDQIQGDELTRLKTTSTLSRAVFLEYEVRGTKDPYPASVAGHQPVLYVGKWKDGLIGEWGEVKYPTKFSKDQTSGIAIRFPRSVPVKSDNLGPDPSSFPEMGLPPRATALIPRYYRAIARLGDIDQVLCPQPADATDYWPWIIRVANADSVGTHADRLHRFDWWPASAPDEYFPPTVANYKSRLLAANALSVGGPWLDKIDNDGDGFADEMEWSNWMVNGKQMKADHGDDSYGGRFGGPEMRVAGLVNLNTACNAALDAVGQGVGIAGLADKVNALRGATSTNDWAPQTAILTPAALLNSISTGAADTIEKRDENYCKISNLCTIRSDTYSIYGTVQYIDPVQMARIGGTNGDVTRRTVRRSRRFWALVDRSPSAAYNPKADSVNFSHPRILNFQWLD
jgi:hypothetical protein